MADDSIQITLPDGSSKAAPAGIRVGDFVKESIGAGLAKAAVLARFNGQDIDLSRPLTESGKLTQPGFITQCATPVDLYLAGRHLC